MTTRHYQQPIYNADWCPLREGPEPYTFRRTAERIQPFRPIRDLGVHTILKAQAHTYNGNIDKRVNLALLGLTLAKEYHSKRHISRIQQLYDRLRVTPLGKHPRLEELQEALRQQTT